MYLIQPTAPADAAGIEALLDLSFGPDRHDKISYRYRRGVGPQPGLSFVARATAAGEALLGSIAFWPVEVGEAGRPALLLGPLAIHPDRRGQGIGAALVARGLNAAARQGHDCALLVGDPDYYQRFGFVAATAYGLVMPDEAPERLQVRALSPGALGSYRGILHPWRCLRRRPIAAPAIAARRLPEPVYSPDAGWPAAALSSTAW